MKKYPKEFEKYWNACAIRKKMIWTRYGAGRENDEIKHALYLAWKAGHRSQQVWHNGGNNNIRAGIQM